MSIDSPAIPPTTLEPQKSNKWLLGCLIALLLVLVIACCAGSLVFLPLFSDFDPLGTNLRERIEELIPLDYLQDPSSIPGMEEYLEQIENESSGVEPGGTPAAAESQSASDLPLAVFSFNTIGYTFSYPSGWDIESEAYAVTFYDPESYTYLYIGEDPVEAGTTAAEVAQGVLESVQEDAQQDTYQLLSSGDYSVTFGEDAYLTLFEWVDQDGYYTWAYDLEIVTGESNLFFFLSGEDPDQIALYGDLLDIIVSSFTQNPESTTGENM